MSPYHRRLTPASRRISALGAAALLALAAPVAAQVIAHPNQIKGTIAFTNTNPAILAYLNDPTDTPPGIGQGFLYTKVQATSRPPQTPTLFHRSTELADGRKSTPYELTVESGPAGSGINYKVHAEGEMNNRGSRTIGGVYNFVDVESDPVEYEPAADLVIDFRECAGLVKYVFLTGDGDPATIDGGDVHAYIEDPPGSGGFGGIQALDTWEDSYTEYHLLVRGGNRYRLDMHYEVGSDPYWDKLRYFRQDVATVACDEVVTVPVTVIGADDPGGGGGGGGGTGGFLGKIVGEVDMIGEAEHRHTTTLGPTVNHYTFLQAYNGPVGNYRQGYVDLSPSSGPYVLPNVMPSSASFPEKGYQVDATLWFRTGNRLEIFRSPVLGGSGGTILVPTGVTVDLGDAFVFDPGTIDGDIRLAGPPADAVLGSPLEDLYRRSAEDDDGDGIPDDPYAFGFGSVVSVTGVSTVAPGATLSAYGGRAEAIFEGAYDPTSADFLGDYELVVGGLHREPSIWQAGTLRLEFDDPRTSVPEDYQNSAQAITPDPRPAITVTAGSRTAVPLHYCMGLVHLRYRSEGGTFIYPSASGTGAFEGIDFEGNDIKYGVDLAWSQGTPQVFPASEGMVVLTLPAGEYTLRPTVEARNPSGGYSRTELNPVDIEVGCRSTIDVWTDFTLDLEALPLCTSDAVIAVSAVVTGPDAIDRIEYTVNGGAPTVVCATCGIAPTVTFPVALALGPNDLTVTAVGSGGRRVSVRSSIERTTRPGDYGNVLLQVKEGLDVHLYWRLPPGVATSELVRDVEKRFLAPGRIETLTAPAAEAYDEGAVPATPEPRYFYRVRGVNCAGEPGP